MADEVYSQASQSTGVSTMHTEMFARYVRSSAFSCYSLYTEAMKMEFEETIDMGYDACICLR
eukprot:1918548-Rhodomonas_salina.1